MLHNLQNGFNSIIAPHVGAVVDDVVTLLHQEFALLKCEVREELEAAKRAAVMLSVAVGCLIVAVFLFSMALVASLAALFPSVPMWGWYLIGGCVPLGAALLLLRSGREAVNEVHIVPEQTVERVKEGLSWTNNET